MRKHMIRYAAIAGVLAAPIAAAVPASATNTGGTSSAYGLSAAGLLAVPQTPSVNSAAAPHVKSVFSLPGNPLVQLSVLWACVFASLSLSGRRGSSSSWKIPRCSAAPGWPATPDDHKQSGSDG